MTAFWAVLTGAASGVLTYVVAVDRGHTETYATVCGAAVTVAMTLLVWLWRTFMKPGR